MEVPGVKKVVDPLLASPVPVVERRRRRRRGVGGG
jgi:hypothetical protein